MSNFGISNISNRHCKVQGCGKGGCNSSSRKYEI